MFCSGSLCCALISSRQECYCRWRQQKGSAFFWWAVPGRKGTVSGPKYWLSLTQPRWTWTFADGVTCAQPSFRQGRKTISGGNEQPDCYSVGVHNQRGQAAARVWWVKAHMQSDVNNKLRSIWCTGFPLREKRVASCSWLISLGPTLFCWRLKSMKLMARSRDVDYCRHRWYSYAKTPFKTFDDAFGKA